MLRDEKGCKLRVIPCNDAGELLIEDYEKLFNGRTKLVAITHVSNALGTVNPVKQMIATAHRHGVPVLVDGAQAVPHLAIDVQDLDCDFYCFSGHKMVGPTGIGILYGKASWLEKMQPYQGGGDMILSVTFEKTTYNVIPHKFEAGTPPIAAAIGLGAAVDYLTEIGMDNIAAWEHELLAYATGAARGIAGRAHRRNGGGQGLGVVLHDRGRASARRRHHPERRRCGGAHRPSLRSTGHAAFRDTGDGACLLRLLQHLRGDRPARGRHPPGAEDVRLRANGQQAALSGAHSRPQQEAA